MCDAIEKQVSENQWIGGQQPSLADREAFEALTGAPNVESHPHAFAWWCLVAKFSPVVRQSWAGAAPAKDAKAPKKEKTVEKKAEKKADEDEFDPFADDDDDDEAAMAALELKHKAAVAKAGKVVKTVIAKSIVVWEVKPYSAETDLDALAKKILAIELDGLAWKTEYKKEPVAFGVFKIAIGAIVEDAKVSTDDVAELIEALKGDEPVVKSGDDDEEEDDDNYLVQSVDIQSFNKL